MKKFFITVIALLLSLSLVASTEASSKIGRVVKLIGEANVINKERNIHESLYPGQYIHLGDEIITGESSFVKILMVDDTLFQLGSQSKFGFEEFKMKSKSERTAVYNLVKGKLRSLFTVKSKERSLTIKTPNVAMGVRGTEIVSDVFELDGEIRSEIGLLSGELEVDQIDGHGKRGKRFRMSPGDLFEQSSLVKVIKSKRKQILSRPNLGRLKKSVFKKLRSIKSGKKFLFNAREDEGAHRQKIIKKAKFFKSALKKRSESNNKEKLLPNLKKLRRPASSLGPSIQKKGTLKRENLKDREPKANIKRGIVRKIRTKRRALANKIKSSENQNKRKKLMDYYRKKRRLLKQREENEAR